MITPQEMREFKDSLGGNVYHASCDLCGTSVVVNMDNPSIDPERMQKLEMFFQHIDSITFEEIKELTKDKE